MSANDAHKTAEYAALYQACMREAVNGGRSMMGKLVDRTRQSLYQGTGMNAEASERNAPMEALRLLNLHEAALGEAFPSALTSAFGRATSDPRARAGGAGSVEAPSFGQLELMDESQVQESVEVARALQAAQLALEAELSELNGLVCAVQMLKTVQPERNPFRPDVYVRCLLDVLKQFDVSAEVRLRWMQNMGMALGQELRPVYQALCRMLRERGVETAGYNVIHSPDSPAPRTSAALPAAQAAAAASRSGAGAARRARDEVLLTVDQLRRLLSGELDPAGAGAAGGGESFAARFAREFESAPREAPPTGFHATVPAAFEALQEMKQVDKVVERLTQRQQGGVGDGGGPPSMREQMRRAAHGIAQSLGLEVVNLMVDNMAGDARLLEPVRQAVRDVEPALLRLALIDPRFFSDREHPARRLLEQLTQRSLAWDDTAAPGFAAFMEPLRQAVDALAQARIEGPEPFVIALKTLEEAWAEQDKRERRRKERAMKALLHAEQRHLLAEKIAAEVRARPDVMVAPSVVVNFLCGPWAQVMAEVRLSDKAVEVDPHGYGALINDIVWSAMPELARSNTARLARLVGPLIERMRGGLKRIDYPADRTEAFFAQLMMLHQQALKPVGAPVAAPSPEAERAMAREAMHEQLRRADEALWVAPAEAQQSGFMDTDAMTSRPAFAATEPGYRATEPQAREAPPLLEEVIQPGAWVEVELLGQRTRSQLTWASPHGALFMFTAASGRTYSMTRASLEKLLAEGGIRVISAQAVVDAALDSVAQTAMRNSLDLSL